MDFDIKTWLDENQARWPSKWTPGHTTEQPQNRRRIVGRRTPIDRARDYVSKIDGAIQGQNGSGKALNVACVLINGFDLTIDQATPLFEEWSSRCDPPWSPHEIQHKLEEAADKDQDKERGYLLNREREGRHNRPQRNARPVAVRPEPPMAEATQEEGACVHGDGNIDASNGEIEDNPPDDGIDYDDDRPEIQVTSDEHIVNLEVLAIIAEDPRIFQRGEILVEDIRNLNDKQLKIINNIGSFKIVPISLAKLRHVIGQNVRFYKLVPIKSEEDEEPEYKKVYIHTPDWCVKSIHGWGGYPGFKVLEGITEVPILHKDGSIFENPGYDIETRMIYEPSCENFPKIADNPSQEDAKNAANRLLDLVCDFPWEEIDKDKGIVHKSSWLAALMTVMCRHLVDGCCPAFLFNANVAGSGKSKLADIIAMIATGRTMPRTGYADNEEEMKKSMISILMSAKPFVLFDNIQTGGSLGGKTVDAVLTSRVYSDRLLGFNKNPEFLVNTVFFATGNQVNLKGDSLRRFVIGKLRSPLESPELRPESEFKIKEKILGYVSRNRGSFVIDVLTIMKAYIKSGMPKGNLIAMGSYEEWSSMIRETVNWVIGHDPSKSQHYLKKEDKQSLARAALLNGWANLVLPSKDNDFKGHPKGVTVSKAVDFLNGSPEKYKILRDALLEHSRSTKRELPANPVIGRFLGDIEDTVIGGRYLKKITDKCEGTLWMVYESTIKDQDESEEQENIQGPETPF